MHKIKAKIKIQRLKTSNLELKICAWGGELLSVKRSPKGLVSHGVCKECAEVELNKLKETLAKKEI